MLKNDGLLSRVTFMYDIREERGASAEPTGLGMERWTDGMGWGPSRVRDEFLFYHQKDSDLGDDPINPVTPWAQTMRRREQSSSRRAYLSSDPGRTSGSDRLVKQTYSVHVSLPADRSRGFVRKWHLTAYFSQQSLDELGTIDAIRGIGDAPVPDGWFRSARVGKPRRDTRGMPDASEVIISPGVPLNSKPSHHASHHSSPPSRHHISASPEPEHPRSGLISPIGAYHESTNRTLGQLVPLEYLENISRPRRDPTDEQLLRRFSTHGPRST